MANQVYRANYEHPITRDDILFLRESDRCYARINDAGQCTLEATKSLTYRGTSVEVTRDLITGWEVVDFEKEEDNPIDHAVVEWSYTGFVAVWHPTLHTIASYVLKAGDLLHLKWIRCNYSDAARAHHVTQDEMELVILRGDPASGKRKKLVFRLASELVFLDGLESCRPVRRKLRTKDYSPTYAITR